MKNIFIFIIIGFVLFLLWKWGIFESAIALISLLVVGAGTTLKQRKDDIKEKQKEIDKIVEDFKEQKEQDDKVTKRLLEEVNKNEKDINDKSLGDLIRSANDRLRKSGEDMDK
jgi:uncharacterized protein YoxC